MGILKAKISDLMSKQNLNPSELERRSGVSRNTINSILSGASLNPTANTLRSLAKGFDVSIEHLLSMNDFEASPRQLTKEEILVLSDVFSYTIEAMLEKNISTSYNGLCEVSKEIYDYTMSATPSVVDKRFINYILDNKYSR